MSKPVEPFLSGARLLETVSLVLDVIEKIKCVWQRNVHCFGLRRVCGDSSEKQLAEGKAKLFLKNVALVS